MTRSDDQDPSTPHEDSEERAAGAAPSDASEREVAPGPWQGPEQTIAMPAAETASSTSREALMAAFARSLAPAQRDLEATLASDTLRPVDATQAALRNSLESFTDLRSIRPRSVQSGGVDDADGGAVGNASADKGGDVNTDYLTIGKLGEGGMATVHLAKQVALGRDVALKRIHQVSRNEDAVRGELLKEAVLTGRLEHPNIIPIYEVGESDDGELFYAMKKIEGRAWSESIDDLSLRENLRILLDVCDAVAFAHSEGVLHRDLKPQNVMTGGFGEVLVFDWGLAVLAEPGKDVQAIAGGTPGYMAPEMIKPPYLVGARSDVYLLGGILFRVLAGCPPHSSGSARTSLDAVYDNEIVEPDQARVDALDPSGELIAIAYRAMAGDPADRFQTVRAFQDAIHDFEAHGESLKLTANAEASLLSAEESQEYATYSRALVGFEEAVKLWRDNAAAVDGVARARRAYALCAERKRDYELGLSLVSADSEADRELLHRLRRGRDDLSARQARLTWMKRVLVIAAVALVAVGAYSLDQRNVAQQSQHETEVARLNAERSQEIAAREAAAADQLRLSKYYADMNLISFAIDNGHTGMVRAWVDAYRDPASAEPDLRGFEWGCFDRQLHSDLRALDGLAGMVTEVRFSADGALVASGDKQGAVKLWKAATGEEVAGIAGHEKGVRGLEFVANGTRLVTASVDGTARVWDTSNGAQVAKLAEDARDLYALAVSADGKTAVTGGMDAIVHVWDIDTGAVSLTLKMEHRGVYGVAISPDGATIATAGADRRANVWDARTGARLASIGGPASLGACDRVVFSPDGQRLVAAYRSGAVRSWDLASGKPGASFAGHRRRVWDIAFSPDGARVATASGDRTIKVWDASSGGLLASLSGHTEPATSIAFGPTGKQLVSGGLDGAVRLWDLVTNRETAVMTGQAGGIMDVAMDCLGFRVASASSQGSVKLWDGIKGSASRLSSRPFTGHDHVVRSVTFTPDGSRVVTGSADRSVRIWDLQTGYELRKFVGHIAQVGAVAVSPDGSRIASASDDWSLRIWDIDTGEELHTQFGHGHYCTSVAYSPDGVYLASGSTAKAPNRVILRDADTGEGVRVLQGPEVGVQQLSFSPDSQLVAAAAGRFVYLWDPQVSQPKQRLESTGGSVMSLAFGPDGEWLAAGSADGAICLWEVSSGRLLRAIQGHETAVRGLAVSPDGTRLASGGADASVRLWDPVSGARAAQFYGYDEQVRGLAFAPDGTRMVACGGVKGAGRVDLRDSRQWSDAAVTWQEARSYLAARTPETRSVEELEDVIRREPMISDSVRVQALELAAGSWRSIFVVPFTGRVQGYYNQGLSRDEILAAIAKDEWLRSQTPASPEQLLGLGHLNASAVNDAIWRIVSDSGRSVADYQRALAMSRRLSAVAGQQGVMLNTIGVAQYRAGKFRAAVETLRRSRSLNEKVSPSAPEDNLFLAMSYQRLGETAEAQRLLSEIRPKIRMRPRNESEVAVLAFLREAEALIDP